MTLISARDVSNNLSDIDSMLAFVTNSGGLDPVPQEVHNALIAKHNETSDNPLTKVATELKEESKTEIVPDINLGEPDGNEGVKEEVKTIPNSNDNEGQEVKEPTKDGETDGINEPEPEDDTTVNFKNIRRKLAETKSELKTKEERLQELEIEIQKYKTGEAIPEEVERLSKENAELARYRTLYDMKSSPEYQEKFIKPLSSIRQKLVEIGADYNVPAEVVEQVLNITNRSQLNEFIMEHFDDLDALEVKQLVKSAQSIQAEAKAAEGEPLKVMNELQSEYERVRQARLMEERQVISDTAKSGWAESIQKIREEGKAQELILKADDEEHNRIYVEPVLRAASIEYGKLVKALAENGLSKLPKDLSFALARMCQLAHAAAVSIDTRAQAIAYAEELEANTKRKSSFTRPQVGTVQTQSNGSSNQSKYNTPSGLPERLGDTADIILNSVLSKR